MNWKPIETAPKDGTIILTKYGLCRYVKDYVTECGNKITGFYACWGDDGTIFNGVNEYDYSDICFDFKDSFWTDFTPPKDSFWTDFTPPKP